MVHNPGVTPLTVDAGIEGIERVLVVTAHPDDVDFGVAGSVAVWTDAGVEVAYCIVTDGDAGGRTGRSPAPTWWASAAGSSPRRPGWSG